MKFSTGFFGASRDRDTSDKFMFMTSIDSGEDGGREGGLVSCER